MSAIWDPVDEIRASEKRFYQKVRDLFCFTGKTDAEFNAAHAAENWIQSHQAFICQSLPTALKNSVSQTS
jgi:hypothetical protein